MWKAKLCCADSDKYSKYLLIILLASLAFAAYHIGVSGYHGMDMDYASDMLWPKLVMERGFFSSGFYGSTENFLTARSIVPSVIARLLGLSWLNVIKINAIFNTALTLFLFFLLLRRLKLSINSTLFACIFMINTYFSRYSIIYDYNIYYARINFIMPILLIFAVDIYQKQFSAKRTAALLVLAFIGGLISLRVLTLVLTPIFMLEFIKAARQVRGQVEFKKPFSSTLTKQMGYVLISLAAFTLGATGYLVSTLFGRYTNTFGGNSLVIFSFDKMLAAFPKILSQLVFLLGFPSRNISVNSISEAFVFLETLLRAGVFIIFTMVFIHVLFLHAKHPAGGGEGEKTERVGWIFAFFLLSLSLNFLLILAAFSEGSASRHQFFIWYLVAILAGVVVDKDIIKTQAYRGFAFLLMGALCIISFYNNSVVVTKHYRQADPPPRVAAAQYLLDNGYDVVLGRNAQDSYVMGGYTDLQLQTAAFSTDFAPHMWLVDTSIFRESKDKYAIIFSDEAREKELLETFLESDQAKTQLIMSEAKFDKSFGPLNIYSLDYNPTLDAVPEINGMISPGSRGVELYNGTLAEDGSFHTDGTAGFVLRGPNWQVFEGVFDFTLNYTVLEHPGEETMGYFDICTDGGEKVLAGVPLSSAGSAAIISGLTFDDLGAFFESRISVMDGAKIIIDSIDVRVQP